MTPFYDRETVEQVMELYTNKNGSAKDAELDNSISDCISICYLDLPLCQRAAIDREAQLLHESIKTIKTRTVAIEIIWAISRKINEVER